ncbi:Lytic transglycosylase domain-containing protein [Candidatus Megaera polyxenophila]|nr:Lytic transglycosylase domain-containing protein [Candidatus Megaera polyxenophila]
MESDSPRLLKTFTSVKGVSSLLEGSKYMLLNLASIYGTMVKELIRPQITPFSKILLPYSKDIYTEKGIAIQVKTFQKLSIDIIDLFGELLISTFRHFRFELHHCIISKFLMFCKGIKFTCMGFLVLLCAHHANADEAELMPLKNELKALITEQEELHKIPSGLLLAIATVESGSKPYALNIQGKSVIGRNKREAVDLIHEALANGITNIDVGVMQLNVRWHRENFGSIEEMLEPKKNIEYAASFLLTLYKKYGDWHRAVRFYHSSTADYYRKYSRKITLAWLGV